MRHFHIQDRDGTLAEFVPADKLMDKAEEIRLQRLDKGISTALSAIPIARDGFRAPGGAYTFLPQERVAHADREPNHDPLRTTEDLLRKEEELV